MRAATLEVTTANHDAEHDEHGAPPPPAYSVHMDAVRALAAFLVLAGHARMLFFGEHSASAVSVKTAPAASVSHGAILGLGAHAVMVFFVLSGFLVGNSAWRAIRGGRWSWRKYLLQRMTRLWIVLLPALMIQGLLDHEGMRLFTANHGIYSAPAGQGMVDQPVTNTSSLKILAGNAVFLQTILVPRYGTNAALWSLANEFWYYVTFPLILLLFVGSVKIWTKVAYAVLALAILAFVGLKIAAFFLIWLLGFAVSLLPLRIPEKYRRTWTLLSLLQFLAVNAYFRTHPTRLPVAAALIGLSFALFLYTILHARQPVRSRVYERIATTFSSFSYTLYLVHLPFLIFIVGFAMRPWHALSKDPKHLALAVLLVVATYTYAWVLYLLFEGNTDKVRHWIAQWFAPTPATSPIQNRDVANAARPGTAVTAIFSFTHHVRVKTRTP